MDAASWKVLSSAYYFLARYPEMIDATNRSLALYTRLGDLYWQGILEGNIASVYAETGDLQRALSVGRGGVADRATVGDADGISFSLATIASIHDLRGEYQSALDADEGALNEIGQHPYPDEEGQVWMGLGQIYDELDDSERERDALSRALPLLRRSGDAASESTALSYLSSLELRENHFRLATEDLDQSMEIAVLHKLPREGAAADLEGDSGRRAQIELAIDAADSGLKLAGQAGEAAILAQLLQEEGDLQARTGNAQAAMSDYIRAESAWSAIPNLEHAALARASIARIEFRSNQLGSARADILMSLDGFEASRKNVESRSLRASWFATVHDFYDLAIEIDMRRSATDRSAEIEAWQIAERARARSLMDAVRSAGAFSTRNLSSELIDQSAAIENRIALTQQSIFRMRDEDDNSAAQRLALQKRHRSIACPGLAIRDSRCETPPGIITLEVRHRTPSAIA